MTALSFKARHLHVREFLERTYHGFQKALSYEGPVLIVSHGGIHWALCYLMDITDHEWVVDNCLPIHFFIGPDGLWKVKKLI
jgi:probable phosphoglycerate mutase